MTDSPLKRRLTRYSLMMMAYVVASLARDIEIQLGNAHDGWYLFGLVILASATYVAIKVPQNVD